MRWPIYALIVLAAALTAVALVFHDQMPRMAEPYAVTDFVYSPDGRTALKAGNDGTLRLLDARNEIQLSLIDGFEAPIRRVAYTRSGSHAIVGTPDSISFVDLSSGTVSRRFDVSGTLVTMAVSPRDDAISVLSRDNKVRIYSADGERRATFTADAGGTLHGTTWCPTDCLLLWGADGLLEVWNPAKPALIATMVGRHRRDIRAAVFSADGQRLGTIDDERSVLVWFTSPANPKSNWGSKERPIALAWSRDRSKIAVETETGKAYIWDLRGGTEPVVVGPKNGVGQGWLAFSPSGRSIVLGSWPDGVRVTQIPEIPAEDWDEGSEEEMREYLSEQDSREED